MKPDSHLAPSDQTLLAHFACLETDGSCATSLGLVYCCTGKAVSGPYILIQVTPCASSLWYNWLSSGILGNANSPFRVVPYSYVLTQKEEILSSEETFRELYLPFKVSQVGFPRTF